MDDEHSFQYRFLVFAAAMQAPITVSDSAIRLTARAVDSGRVGVVVAAALASLGAAVDNKYDLDFCRCVTSCRDGDDGSRTHL